MCGIAGFLGRDGELLSRMLTSIVHRGPDDWGAEVNDHVSIGMRRLSIIDVETGRQPLYSDDGAVALVYNGEIYNAPELRGRLEALGHAFSTDHADSEVVLRGYEHWGREVVSHLTGMFAFAIWDGRQRKLFLARDRLGIKPLYFTKNVRGFAFASEIKALLQNPAVPRRVNMRVLNRFLLHRVHDADEETFFEGIDRLLPAHTMMVDLDGAVETTRYWSPEVNLDFASSHSDEAYSDEFRALYDRVVQRHLLSDVAVGVPLSGGLDSSGVACTLADLMNHGANLHTNGVLHTFSALYPGQWNDESDWIHEVERRVHSTAHYAYPDPDAFWDEMSEWMWFQEEPTIASAPYAYYCVYRITKGQVKVMLSGNGGDELLAGYIPYFRAFLTSARDQGRTFTGIRELARGWDQYRGYFADLVRERSPFGSTTFDFRPWLRESAGELAKVTYSPSRNLNRRLADDVLNFSTPNLLRYEDKNSMAFSIEARVPFLDHELVEFIFGLPIDQKIKGGWHRSVYLRAMKGRIPEKNRLRRKKIGFANPEYDWMRKKADDMRRVFTSSACRDRGIYDTDNLLTTFDAWLKGAPGDGMAFWRFLVTELWMQRYLDQPVLVTDNSYTVAPS
jgi:asparagine synthase (glutamine-hydrolysing)